MSKLTPPSMAHPKKRAVFMLKNPQFVKSAGELEKLKDRLGEKAFRRWMSHVGKGGSKTLEEITTEVLDAYFERQSRKVNHGSRDT